MFSLYDKVRIKSSNLIGTIVDISTVNEKDSYIIESDIPDIQGGYGGKWKLFNCSFEEIEVV